MIAAAFFGAAAARYVDLDLCVVVVVCVCVCVRDRRRYIREQYTHTPLLFLQAIQMHRHTHDETQYPYERCSINGLPPTAPSIV
jgi:hypothetical protein